MKNFDDGIDDECFWKEFFLFGIIISVKVMMEGGCSKGFGFVCFFFLEEVIKVVIEMNGRIVVIKLLYVVLV